MVRGSNDAFRARQPTTTQTSVSFRASLARRRARLRLHASLLKSHARRARSFTSRGEEPAKVRPHLSFQTTNRCVGRYGYSRKVPAGKIPYNALSANLAAKHRA